jgi:hypothetical protein
MWSIEPTFQFCSYLLTLVLRSPIFLPWRWRRYDAPKRRFNRPHLHGATPQKTAFFRKQCRLTTGFLTGHCTLRRHLRTMGSLRCWKCGQDEESSNLTLRQCWTLAIASHCWNRWILVGPQSKRFWPGIEDAALLKDPSEVAGPQWTQQWCQYLGLLAVYPSR